MQLVHSSALRGAVEREQGLSMVGRPSRGVTSGRVTNVLKREMMGGVA
jgi:hypothetical protein